MSFFSAFCTSEDLKEKISALIAAGRFPHAVLLCGEDGAGRNYFARLTAAEYLDDSAGLALRGVHPDCLFIRGEGASGEIRVGAVRDMAYEINRSAVMTDGRRMVIIEDAANLNRSSSAALLKTLEQPPDGVSFILTAASEKDVIDTVLSRCVRMRIFPPSPEKAAAFALDMRPDADPAEIRRYAALFRGRIGFLLRALDDPGFRESAERAGNFFAAFQKGDRIMMMSALDAAEDRVKLKELLNIAALALGGAAVNNRDPRSADAAKAIERMKPEIDRNVAHKLFSTLLVSRLAGG